MSSRSVEGAKRGRPKGINTAPVNLSLPLHMIAWLNKQGGKSKTVQRLIQHEMEQKPED